MATLPEPVRSSIAAIVNYGYASEEADYVREGEPEGHIFEHLKRVSDWLVATNKTATKNEPESASDWLLAMHRMLFPERYPRDLQPDHVYWEQAADDPDAAEPFEWDSETIEWVATMLEQALRTHPDARLKP